MPFSTSRCLSARQSSLPSEQPRRWSRTAREARKSCAAKATKATKDTAMGLPTATARLGLISAAAVSVSVLALVPAPKALSASLGSDALPWAMGQRSSRASTPKDERPAAKRQRVAFRPAWIPEIGWMVGAAARFALCVGCVPSRPLSEARLLLWNRSVTAPASGPSMPV